MKNKILILAVLLIITFASCKKFLDINHDPNRTESASMDLILPAAIENAASVIGNYFLALGEIWSQHWTSDANAPDYQNEDSYNVTAGDYSYDIAGWSNLYANALMDFEAVRDSALKNHEWAYYLVATTMQCYVYQVLADYFDKIPLSEALQGVPPRFDDGDVVYDTLIARLDFALEKYKNCLGCKAPGEDDLIFYGDMDAWVAFANTLKLKIFLRQINKRPDVAEQGIRDMYNNGATFLTKDAKFDQFADEAGRDNYFYAREYRGRGNINIRASKTFIDYIKAFEDPRIDYLFYRPKGEEDDPESHRGMYQGDFRNVYSYPNQDPPEISRPRITATTPTYFMTEAESYFLQAEAKVRFPDLPGDDAKTLFEKGIAADFQRLMSLYKGEPINDDENLEDIDYQDILNKQYYTDFDVNTMPKDTLIKRIIYQKWIALANIEGSETFFEHNRTGFPENSPVNPGDDDFQDKYIKGQFTVSVTGVLPASNPYPKRLLFPSTEQSRNPNTPDVKPLYTPVWWDPESDY